MRRKYLILILGCLFAISLFALLPRVLSGSSLKDSDKPDISVASDPLTTDTPEVLSTESPVPGSTAFPWESDPSSYILDRLNQGLDTDGWIVRFWIYPGSGPITGYMGAAEYGQSIQELFCSLDWKVVTWSQYNSRDFLPQPGAYSIQLFADADKVPESIICDFNDDIIRLDAPEGYDTPFLYFSADGANAICDKLATLWPGPGVNLGRVRTPPQGTQKDTATLYMEQVLSKLQADGHITEYKLSSLQVESSHSIEPDQFTFRTSFILRPARPELSYWQDGNLHDLPDQDGWVKYEWRETIGFNPVDGLYGLL